jgi:hypothetical protein
MARATNPYAQVQEQWQKSQEAVNKRFGDVMNIYDKVATMFAPGGEFGKGFNMLLDQTKDEFIEEGIAGLSKRGLSNVTSVADLGLAFEQKTGAQQRQSMYERGMDKYASTLLGKAGAIERVEDVPPDLNRYAQLTQRAASTPTNASSYGSASSRWASHPIMGTQAKASRSSFFGHSTI